MLANYKPSFICLIIHQIYFREFLTQALQNQLQWYKFGRYADV